MRTKILQQEANMMEFLELIQTTSAFSGLICLMIMLLSAKKQLKRYARS